MRRRPLHFLVPRIFLLALVIPAACSREQRIDLGDPQGAAYVVRGRELYKGAAACGFCHNEEPEPRSPAAGGRRQWDTYGELRAPNLTPAASGLAGWSTNDIMQALRGSRGKDGALLSEQVHQGYEWMSDQDALSIIAYLKSLPPIENVVPRRGSSFLARNTVGLFEAHDEQRGYVPEIDPRYPVEYGKYLTDHVARCGSCHSRPSTFFSSSVYLGGGRLIQTEHGEKYAPALANSAVDGIGEWSEGDIVHYLQSGETPSGAAADPRFCPTGFYRNASTRELEAIAKYLKSR